jgi:hypothetical protein
MHRDAFVTKRIVVTLAIVVGLWMWVRAACAAGGSFAGLADQEAQRTSPTMRASLPQVSKKQTPERHSRSQPQRSPSFFNGSQS